MRPASATCLDFGQVFKQKRTADNNDSRNDSNTNDIMIRNVTARFSLELRPWNSNNDLSSSCNSRVLMLRGYVVRIIQLIAFTSNAQPSEPTSNLNLLPPHDSSNPWCFNYHPRIGRYHRHDQYRSGSNDCRLRRRRSRRRLQ